MKTRKIPAHQVQEVRTVVRELVAEVTRDLAVRSGNPGVLLDMAGDLEAHAKALRQDFARRGGR